MHEIFVEIKPRIWIAAAKQAEGFHTATSAEELRLIAATQAIYDSLSTYRDAYNFYYTFNSSIPDPTICDFFPRFQLNLLNAVQRCENIEMLLPAPQEEHKRCLERIKESNLEQLTKAAKGKLAVDSETEGFLLAVTLNLTDADKVTLLGHIRGNHGYARNLKIYSGLSSLDQYLEEPFFAVAAEKPRHTILQEYNAAIFKRLEHRASGFERKNKPLKTISTIPKEDLAIIEDIAKRLAESFPKAEKSNDSERSSDLRHYSGITTANIASGQNRIKIPHFKNLSALLDDYLILNFSFSSVVGEYLKKSGEKKPSITINKLFDALIFDKPDSCADLVEKYKSGEIDSSIGLEGNLKNIVTTLTNLCKFLPKEAITYLEERADYEIDWLRVRIGIGHNIKQKLKIKEAKIKGKETCLFTSYGIQLSHKQFIEHISNLEQFIQGKERKKVERFKNAFNAFPEICSFFTAEDVKKCLEQYNVKIDERKLRQYFYNTMRMQKE